MAIEIERKFLVKGDFRPYVMSSKKVIQGYLSSQTGRTVRVRIMGEKGFLTIKGPTSGNGTTRFEFEKEIELSEAEGLIGLCGEGVISKVRHYVPAGNHVFEVDEFHGDNEGLVVAEVELSDEREAFERPDWLGEEVTGQRKYYNSMLLAHPFKDWDSF